MIDKYLKNKLGYLNEWVSGNEWREVVYPATAGMFISGIIMLCGGLLIGLLAAPVPAYLLGGIGIALVLPGIIIDYTEFKQENSNHH